MFWLWFGRVAPAVLDNRALPSRVQLAPARHVFPSTSLVPRMVTPGRPSRFSLSIAYPRGEPGSRSQETLHGHKKKQGRFSEDWTVRLDITHVPVQSASGRAHGARAAHGEMVQRTGRCVSLSPRDGVRAKSRLDMVTRAESPSAEKERHHKHRLLCTRALCTYTDTREHESLTHTLTHALTHAHSRSHSRSHSHSHTLSPTHTRS